MWRPVPTADDVMRTTLSRWLLRYQCHITRIDDKGVKHSYTAKPDMQVRDRFPNLSSYIHFDHGTALPEIFPPVYVVEGQNPTKTALDYSAFRSMSSSESVVDEVKEQQSSTDLDEHFARELHASLNPNTEDDERLARQLADEGNARGKRSQRRASKRQKEQPAENSVQDSLSTDKDSNAMDLDELDPCEDVMSKKPELVPSSSTKRNRAHTLHKSTMVENIAQAKKLKIMEVSLIGQINTQTFPNEEDFAQLEDYAKQLLLQCPVIADWLKWLQDSDLEIEEHCVEFVVFATYMRLGIAKHPVDTYKKLWLKEYFKYSLTESGTLTCEANHLPSPFLMAALCNSKRTCQGDLSHLFSMDIPENELLATVLAIDFPTKQLRSVLYIMHDKSSALWVSNSQEWHVLSKIVSAVQQNQMQVGVHVLVVAGVLLPESHFPSNSFKKNDQGLWQPVFEDDT
jgi:hypothetical protein